MNDQTYAASPRRLAVSLFGLFDARLDEKPINGFEYNKVRALLAYLAVEHARPHPRSSLCTLLWPELGESAARQNLSQALTRLRQVLGDKSAPTPFLLTTTETVQLNPLALCDVDVIRFTKLVAEAEGHAHRGWHLCTPCAKLLGTAVALFKGDFLAQLYVSDSDAFEEWALALRQRLRLRMLSALERLIQHAEWRGAYTEAIGYAQRQIELEPLRDHAHRELMRLLALSGQYMAALTHYQHLQHTLAAELDAEPEVETTALYDQICAGAHTDAFRRWAAPPHALPTPPTALVGRVADVEAICDRITGSGNTTVRLLTITGAPGIGKTRLALEVAQRLRFDFHDGVHLVELAPVQDAMEVPASVAAVVGIKEQAGRSIAATVQDHFQSKHSLLVLDNFEHVLDAAPFVAALIAACPALTVLITSRVPLHLRAEEQRTIQPLPVPPTDAALDRIADTEAVQLFVQRARSARPEWTLTPADVRAVAAICRHLDGLPLAIELIAPRLKTLSVVEILAQWDGRLSSFPPAPRDVPTRHRTLRNAIQWSFDRLSAEEQRVWTHLGVFSGGCTAEAAQWIIGQPAVLPILEALHDASVVYTQSVANTTRFMQLETIGEFALEMLTASGGVDRARQRYVDYYVNFADTAYTELLGSDQAQWCARIAAEQDNIRAALRWAISHDLIESALRIATGIWRFWWQRGLLREGSDWLETALARRDEASLAIQTKALRAVGVLLMGLNEYDRARERLEQAVAIASAIDAVYDRAAATTNLGLVLREQGDFDRACRFLQQAISLNRLTPDPRSVKFPMIILAELHARMGDATQAGALYSECLRLNRDLGDAEGTANALYGMGVVALAQREYARAQQWCDESIALYGTLDHQFGLGYCYGLLGDLACAQADSDHALMHYGHALAIWIEREDRVSGALVLEGMAKAVCHRGQMAQAVQLMAAAHAIRARADANLTAKEQSDHQQLLDRCRAALGEIVFGAAWSEGRGLRLEQAMALALHGEILTNTLEVSLSAA